MRPLPPTAAAALNRPRTRAKPADHGRRGFSLTEMLVAIAIIAILMGLVGAAVSAARTGQKGDATRRLIQKLDAIVSEQFGRYDSMSLAAAGITSDAIKAISANDRVAYRAWFIRRNWMSADLPDRWTDVEYMATPSNLWQFRSGPQRTYADIWTAASPKPSSAYAGAECLFMIVMAGGIADCLDCGELKTVAIGDTDNDGFNEFLDDWGNPIGFILWPCGVELPVGSGTLFFSGTRQLANPFGNSPTPSLGMRPLIYSAGPDGEYGFDRRNETRTLDSGSASPYGLGSDCGNWLSNTFATSGGQALVEGRDVRLDNITNLDAEARQ